MPTAALTTRLQALVEGLRDVWAEIDALCAAPPPGLIPAAVGLLEELPSTQAQALVRLLGRLGSSSAIRALVGLLSPQRPGLSAQVLSQLNRLGVQVPASSLGPLLASESPGVVHAALASAGHNAATQLRPVARRWLASGDAEARAQAAVALGRMGAVEVVDELAARLPDEPPRVRMAYVVALELLAQPSAVPAVARWLARAPAEEVRPLVHLLWCLTQLEGPVVTLDVEALRRSWLRLVEENPDRPSFSFRRFSPTGPRVASFDLLGGLGQVYTAFDVAVPGELVRWSRSLYVDGRRVFDLGARGGTCEGVLRLAGWSTQVARDTTRDVVTALRACDEVNLELIEACLPLLAAFRSGRYLAALLDVPIERIRCPEESWLSRRRREQAAASLVELWAHASPSPPPPRGVHYQAPMAVGDDPSTYVLVMPSQPTERLTDEGVARALEEIAGGARPPVLALGWLEDRSHGGAVADRLLEMVVLDGHHRLEAYAQAGTSARIFVLCRVDDSWGPRDDPERFLRRCFAALGASEE